MFQGGTVQPTGKVDGAGNALRNGGDRLAALHTAVVLFLREHTRSLVQRLEAVSFPTFSFLGDVFSAGKKLRQTVQPDGERFDICCERKSHETGGSECIASDERHLCLFQ